MRRKKRKDTAACAGNFFKFCSLFVYGFLQIDCRLRLRKIWWVWWDVGYLSENFAKPYAQLWFVHGKWTVLCRKCLLGAETSLFRHEFIRLVYGNAFLIGACRVYKSARRECGNGGLFILPRYRRLRWIFGLQGFQRYVLYDSFHEIGRERQLGWRRKIEFKSDFDRQKTCEVLVRFWRKPKACGFI